MKHITVAVLLLVFLAACMRREPEPCTLCARPTADSLTTQPDAFSPNGDGLNDVFRYIMDSQHTVTSQEWHIYDGSGAEVAVIWGANGAWDGRDQRTGKPAAPGYYRLEFGVVFTNPGTPQVAADGEKQIALFGSGPNGCLRSLGCPPDTYTFEDQIDTAAGRRAHATAERFCN